MGLPALAFAVNKVGAVQLVFAVGDLLDDGARGFAVGRCGVGFQVGLGRVKPIKAVLNLVFQDIGVPLAQPVDLLDFKLSFNSLSIAQPLCVVLEWRCRLPARS